MLKILVVLALCVADMCVADPLPFIDEGALLIWLLQSIKVYRNNKVIK